MSAVLRFGAAATLALAMLVLHHDGARAQNKGGFQASPPQPFTTQHQSLLQIRSNEPLPQTRTLTVARNKSMVIELPRDLRDVIVSAPDVLDAVVQSSNRVYLIGKKPGQSNAFFFDSNGEQILTLEIMVDRDTGDLDALLRRLIPASNIKAEIINENVILTGSVRSPQDSARAFDVANRFAGAGKALNMLTVEGDDQVMLRVTVAEVQRSALKQLGINLGAVINGHNFSTALLTANSLPLTAAAGLGTLPVSGLGTGGSSATGCAVSGALCGYNSGPSGSYGNSGINGGGSFGNSAINGALRALERDGLVRTLAEPNLTAVSGESASFLAGGEYPIPIVDDKGSVSVSFKKFGVSLAFTPVVLSEGRISLKIETEVSELSNSGAVTLSNISIPALKKREAKSTVEMPSGASVALAGLISDSTRQNVDGFPGLKELPILGTLFRSRDFIKEETELVVIVTPYVVRPVQRQKLARPDDNLLPSGDINAKLRGEVNRISKRPTVTGGSLKDYGFIVE
jgi:pilus assembly protein CpaC